METTGTNTTTNVTASTTTNTGTNTTASSPSPNIVTIPVPIVPPEDIYTYVAVKGSLHSQDCAIFGLDEEEVHALTKRFPNISAQTVNGIMIKAPPLDVINTLSKLSYKVICSTGEAEIVWTMQREV